MRNEEILSTIDHSALSTTLTYEELIKEIDFAVSAGCACLAITPHYAKGGFYGSRNFGKNGNHCK